MITLKSGKTIELNQAFNVDCLDFMRELPDKCIDLVLTDPPYGIGGGTTKTGGLSNKNSLTRYKNENKAKGWDNKEPIEEVFYEIFRISKNQIIWGGNYFNLNRSRCFIVWDKMTYAPSMAQIEMAWTNYDSHPKLIKINSNQKDRFHPTQKPVKLFKWCLENYAKEDAVIFDPFLGSFTTSVACHHYGLNWLGCEKDPDYFKSGYHRYEQEAKQQLFDF